MNAEIWNSFVDRSSTAWLWHRYEMGDALSTWQGLDDRSFAVIENGHPDRILAIVPLHAVRGRGWKRNLISSLNSTGGPAFEDDLGENLIGRLWKFVLETIQEIGLKENSILANVVLAAMTPAYRGESTPKVNPLLPLGGRNTLSQTWVIDLRAGQEHIWSTMEKRARNAVRKAEKLGVQVRVAKATIEDLNAYYDLHVETYRRTHVRPHPLEYFRRIWEDFLAAGTAWTFFAELEGDLVAADCFSVYKGGSLYWTGASSQPGLQSNAGSLIQWTAIQQMQESSIDWYETGEAFPFASGKARGLSDFKKSFGGELYPLFRCQIDLRPTMAKVLRLFQ